MELSILLVIVINLFLILQNVVSTITEYSDPQMSLWTLTVRHHVISINENGTLFSSPTMPTLYSIFRSELYYDENELFSQPEFSLIGIASGYRICMNKNGYVYTKKVTKEEKRLVKRKSKSNNKEQAAASDNSDLNINRDNKEVGDNAEDSDDDTTSNFEEQKSNSNTKFASQKDLRESSKSSSQIPPAECLFKAYGFDQKSAYTHKSAIYSVIPYNPTSTTTIGNFIAFLKNGDPRRFRRPLENIRLHGSILIQFDPLKKPSTSSISARSSHSISNNNNNNNNNNIFNSEKKVEKMLTQTTFNYCDGRKGRKSFNIKVRDCVKSSTKSLNLNRLNHINLFKIIQQCLCPLGKTCRNNDCVRLNSNNKMIKRKNNNNTNNNNNSNNNNKNLKNQSRRNKKINHQRQVVKTKRRNKKNHSRSSSSPISLTNSINLNTSNELLLNSTTIENEFTNSNYNNESTTVFNPFRNKK